MPLGAAPVCSRQVREKQGEIELELEPVAQMSLVEPSERGRWVKG